MRRFSAVLVLALLLPLLMSPMSAVAQAPTPVPALPLPNGWGPAGSLYIAEILDTDRGHVQLLWDAIYPCDEVLDIYQEFGRVEWPSVLIRLTQTVPSGDLRIRAAMAIGSIRMAITAYRSDGTVISTQTFWGHDFPYIDPETPWFKLVDIVISADPGYGGYILIAPMGTITYFGSHFLIAGLYAADNNYGFPAELCGDVPATPTPTTTPSPTTTQTPSPTPTGGWTPSPTITPTATTTPTATYTPWPTSPGQTATPTPTWIPATWTPQPTYTPWPSPTPLPGAWDQTATPPYATPPGAWGTPVVPTLEPMATSEPVHGFTPNATYEANVEAVSTLIGFGSAFATSVYTLTNWSIDLTLEPLTFFTTSLTATGTISNPTFTLQRLTLPIGYIKGFIRYMPNLGPLILALFAVWLWMISFSLISFGYRVVVWCIDKIERILSLIGEYLPTGG